MKAPELVIDPSRKPARRVDERNSAFDAQRIAGEFRGLVTTGKFTPADRGLVEDALRFAALTRSESETARDMLDQVSEHASFVRGYDRERR
jgi:hypothetical protein